MKYQQLVAGNMPRRSPPSRGAWIEMPQSFPVALQIASPPSRGAWIEISTLLTMFEDARSPPSRGAWIEISSLVSVTACCVVAPLAGGVD